MDTQTQIQEFFQELGMPPERIRYNENLDRYLVDIGVEGTDEKFLRDIGEVGSSGPVDNAVDTVMLERMVPQIQGADLPAGTIHIIDTMKDSHFRIEIQ